MSKDEHFGDISDNIHKASTFGYFREIYESEHFSWETTGVDFEPCGGQKSRGYYYPTHSYDKYVRL